MIQLRKIRPNLKKGMDGTFESALDPPITVGTLADLFANWNSIVEKIPAEERWNIFYTLGMTSGDRNRDWFEQDVIPFDIDGVVPDDVEVFDVGPHLAAIFSVLQVDRTKCAVVASGNGLHVLVRTMEPIREKSFFAKQRKAYENICKDIAKALTAAGLKFKDVDSSSFAVNRILRMPGTENRKAGKASRTCVVLNAGLEPQPFAITPPKDDGTKVREKDQLSERTLSSFKIDTPAVEAGCEFLKWAKASPGDLNEPQWYGLLSIVGRLDDGRAKAHAYSEGHARYSERDTDRKLDQALAASGPRTCENIDKSWGRCNACPYYRKLTSPITIRDANFIATADNGFYLEGNKPGSKLPQYDDLCKHFAAEHAYRVDKESGLVYVWEKTEYRLWTTPQLRNYAHTHFDPKPSESIVKEFIGWMTREPLIGHDWFQSSTRGYTNFANGVLEHATGALLPHDPQRGFLNTLPFAYDPHATSPVFDRFMKGITVGDAELESVLLEYVGYALCDSTYWLQKALILVGEGSNGKTTFLHVVKELAGERNVSALSLHDIALPTERYHLEGKLLNISDELPNTNFRNTEELKKIMGGTMSIRRLYSNSTTIENTAKLIFAGNAMPSSNDSSHGFFRRLIIVPFNAKFSLETDATATPADVGLFERMRTELPGIYNRVAAAYAVLKDRGYLGESKRVAREMADYKAETDQIGTWVQDHLYWNGKVDDEAPYLKVEDVFAAFNSMSLKTAEKPIPRSMFIKQLKRHIDRWEERYVRSFKRNKDRGSHIMRGVEFRGPADQPL